jgi:anti-sigma factor ChrR (cupin superfamily)
MRHEAAEDEIRERAALHAIGALTEHEAHAFESHLAEGCEVCEAELQAFTAVVAQLGFDAMGAKPPAEMREKLLERIVAEKEQEESRATSLSNLPPQFLTVRTDEGEWLKVAPGAFFKQLFADQTRKTVTWMVKMEPGARLPKHRHLGIEESIVLTGDCWANGERFGPGDYRCALPGSVDEVVSTMGGTTLLLIAPMEVEWLEQLSS